MRFLEDYQHNVVEQLLSDEPQLLRAGRGCTTTTMMVSAAFLHTLKSPEGKAIILAPNLRAVHDASAELLASISRYQPDFDIHASKYRFDFGRRSIEFRWAQKEETIQGICDSNIFLGLVSAQAMSKTVLDIFTSYDNYAMTYLPAGNIDYLIDLEKSNKTTVLNSEYCPFTSAEWLESMRGKYIKNGIVDNMYRIHVMGEYPVNI